MNYKNNNTNFMAMRRGVISANDVWTRLAPSNGRRFTLYAALNKINLHVYVGMTSRTLKRRAAEHYCDSTRRPKGYFHRAIAKYGRDNFAFYAVLDCRTLREAQREEQLLIEDLRPEYNMTLGGEGGFGHTVSLEHRAKLAALRKASRGKLRSPHAAAACIANAKKAHETTSRPVICENDGRAYPTTYAAGAAYGLRNHQVSRYCLGINKSRRGLRFRFLDVPQ